MVTTRQTARRHLWAFCIAVAALATPASCWPAGAPSPAERAQAFLDRMKTLPHGSDAADQGKAGRDSLGQELQEVDAELRGYLNQHPDDTKAAVLSMELYGLRDILDSYTFIWTQRSGLGEDVKAYAAIADRALQADSTNAELHHWRGRLYAASGDWDSTGLKNVPLPEAIREARHAVALDPNERRYRESLGSILLVSGDEAAARAAFREIGTDHPLYLLLHDWERLPQIQGMEPIRAPRMPVTVAVMGAVTHSYLFRGTAAEFASRARKLWPGFRLAGGDTTHTGYEHRGGWHLIWKGDALTADPHGETQPEIGAGGLWIDVLEVRATETIRDQVPQGVKVGETFCLLTCLDLRALPAR